MCCTQEYGYVDKGRKTKPHTHHNLYPINTVHVPFVTDENTHDRSSARAQTAPPDAMAVWFAYPAPARQPRSIAVKTTTTTQRQYYERSCGED
jgi:hypothetical protein